MRAWPLILLAACHPQRFPDASPAVSYEAHMAEATRLEREATRHQEAAEAARQKGTDYRCDTSPETEQANYGAGVGVEGTRVCDDYAARDRRSHEGDARKLRKEANRHRAQARTLLDREQAACAGFGLEQLRDTPIGRARADARVEEIAGGVRIRFAAGPGRTLDEVRRELDCHRARAALYEADDYMGHDPALVPATRVWVEAGDGGGIVVTIHGEDPVAVDVARKRASGLATLPR